MVTSLKFKVTFHVRIVVYVIEDVLRRSASAVDFWRLLINLHFLISNDIRFIVICNRLSSLFFDWSTRIYFWCCADEILSKRSNFNVISQFIRLMGLHYSGSKSCRVNDLRFLRLSFDFGVVRFFWRREKLIQAHIDFFSNYHSLESI